MVYFVPNVVIGTLFMMNIGLWCWSVGGTPSTVITKEGCDETAYPADDPHLDGIAFVLNDVLTVTPTRDGYHYASEYSDPSRNPSALAFGQGSCNPALSVADCATCMAAAFTEIRNQCFDRIQGDVVLQDCRIGYQGAN